MYELVLNFDKFDCGTWSILIEHPSGRRLIYDLGMRKDWQNAPPSLNLQKYFDDGIVEVLEASKNVSEILEQGGLALEEIEGVIWSHWHFDRECRLEWTLLSSWLLIG